VPTFDYGTFNATFGPTLGTGGVVLVAAGMMIGYGARRAGGCTSGHGMCGAALASPASLVATMTFMATAVAVTNLLVRGLGVGS
jgi:uncharacterized membrane protein YedE/YeeE